MPTVCCPPGAIGSVPLNKLAPKGKTVNLSSKVEGSTLSDIACYQTGPTESIKRIIVVFSDVYGPETGNHKVICDVLQEKLGDDTAVWMPDVFRGRPLLYDWGTWYQNSIGKFQIVFGVRTYMTASAVEKDFLEILQPNVKETGCEFVGALGFCYGGWMVGRALSFQGDDDDDEGSIFSAGVGFHPSWLPETVAAGGTSPIKLAERVKQKPLLFLPAKEDAGMKAEDEVAIKLAEQRGIKPEEVSIEFPTMSHGWVNRGDPSQPEVKENQDKAINLAIEFFNKHLS